LTRTLTDGVHDILDILCGGRPIRPLHWRRALHAPYWYACLSPARALAFDGRAHIDTGKGERFNVGAFLEETNPYSWAALGIGLCLGLSVLGAGWCVNRGPAFPRFCTPSDIRQIDTGVSSSLVLPFLVVVCAHREFVPRISSGLSTFSGSGPAHEKLVNMRNPALFFVK
jgi:hypothetical protein